MVVSMVKEAAISAGATDTLGSAAVDPTSGRAVRSKAAGSSTQRAVSSNPPAMPTSR